MRLIDQTYNRLRTLRTLRRAGAISRVELAQRTGLTKATMTALADELIRKGLLAEDPPLQIGRGRPRINLRIRHDAAYAVSLFPLTTDETASIDIVDMHGNRVHNYVGALPRLTPAAEIPALIAELLKQCLDGAPLLSSAVKVAAIIIPGQIDQRRGVVHWLPDIGPAAPWPLKEILEPLIGIPVVVENRATAVARAEHWFGHPDHSDDFSLFALMEWGMSGARYSSGTLQSGYNGMNSEMSHIKIAFDEGRSCFCGGTGCLATYATASAIVMMLAERKGIEVPDGPMPETLFAEAVTAAERGDEDALAVFAIAGRALGAAIAGHVNEHDPGRVILSSARGDLLRLLEPAFHTAYEREVLSALRERTLVQTLGFSPDSAWRGAAAVAIEEIFVTF